MTSCKNCNEPVEQQFCPKCGQRVTVKRITLSGLVRDLPHAIFHVDKGILYNVTQLIKRPGEVILDYLGGKRKPFFHPASFLVIALVLNYLVVKVIDLHFYYEKELQGMDPLAAQLLRDYDALQWWFLEHTYIYIVLAIPASSLFLFLVFNGMRRHFNLAETAVVVLFTIAEGVLIQSLIYLLFGWVRSGPFIRMMESVNLIILVTYASVVIYQLIPPDRSKPSRLLVSFLSGFGLAAIWVASAYLLYYVIG